MVRALNFPRRYGNLTQFGALPDEHRFERIDALRSSPWNRPTEKLAGASFGFVSGLGEAQEYWSSAAQRREAANDLTHQVD